MHSVKPVHYDLSIHDLELGGEFSFQGELKIDLEIQKATKEVVINAHQLKLHSAMIEHTNSNSI